MTESDCQWCSGDPHESPRYLKYKNRTLAKQNGKQGETIHRLRAELAEVRSLNSRIDRGELRRLERVNHEVGEIYREVVAENIELRSTVGALEEKLKVLEDYDDVYDD